MAVPPTLLRFVEYIKPFVLVYSVDYLLNMICNDVSYEVQQRSSVLVRCIPYIPGFIILSYYVGSFTIQIYYPKNTMSVDPKDSGPQEAHDRGSPVSQGTGTLDPNDRGPPTAQVIGVRDPSAVSRHDLAIFDHKLDFIIYYLKYLRPNELGCFPDRASSTILPPTTIRGSSKAHSQARTDHMASTVHGKEDHATQVHGFKVLHGRSEIGPHTTTEFSSDIFKWQLMEYMRRARMVNKDSTLVQLAQRLTNTFCAGISASSIHTWTYVSGNGGAEIRVMTRKSMDNRGEPHGLVISAAHTLWLPVSPQRVFEYLRDERLRHEWDMLSLGGAVAEMPHITREENPGNSVSLLRANPTHLSHNNIFVLQESSTDPSGSLVVYAPIDISQTRHLLKGGDPDFVAILPSGFAIVPDDPYNRRTLGVNGGLGCPESAQGTAGSLLTAAFQILVSSAPTAKLQTQDSTTVTNVLSCTVQKIRNALHCNHNTIRQ